MNLPLVPITVKTLAILWRSILLKWYWNRPRLIEATFNQQLGCDKSCVDLLRDKSHHHVLTNFTEPYPCLCHVTVKLEKCLKGKGANFSQFNPIALFRLGRPFCVNRKLGAVVNLFRALTNRTALFFVHQVLEMLVTVVNCYQRDEVKWKSLSGQIIDLLLPLLANQKVA